MALVLGSSSMAGEPRPEPSTTARVVKGLDWTAVSLLSGGLVLQSVSLLSSDGRPAVDAPLFTAFVLSFVGGVMTGIVSTVLEAVTELTSPGSDVPGPHEFGVGPSRTGRLLQTTGLVVTFVDMLAYGIGNVLASMLSSGPRRGRGLAPGSRSEAASRRRSA